MLQDVCDKIVLSAVDFVCDYQGKIDVEKCRVK